MQHLTYYRMYLTNNCVWTDEYRELTQAVNEQVGQLTQTAACLTSRTDLLVASLDDYAYLNSNGDVVIDYGRLSTDVAGLVTCLPAG